MVNSPSVALRRLHFGFEWRRALFNHTTALSARKNMSTNGKTIQPPTDPIISPTVHVETICLA
jgi:hypothetical protein